MKKVGLITKKDGKYKFSCFATACVNSNHFNFKSLLDEITNYFPLLFSEPFRAKCFPWILGSRVNLNNSQDFLRILEKACDFITFSEIAENFQRLVYKNFTRSRFSREFPRILENNVSGGKVIQNAVPENSQGLSGISRSLLCALIHVLYSVTMILTWHSLRNSGSFGYHMELSKLISWTIYM